VTFDATVPVTQAFGDAAATGAAAVAARRDHKHGMPSIGVILDRKVTDTTNVSSASESDCYRKTVTGNTMGANGILRLRLAGTYLNNTGSNQTLVYRVKFGATTVFASSALSIPTSVTRRHWHVDLVIWNAAATGTQRATATAFLGATGAASFDVSTTFGAGGPYFYEGGDGASSEDTTANKDVAFTAQHGAASATLDIITKEGVLEFFA
jgi:hypothetical protein